jgi:hypothetical protein
VAVLVQPVGDERVAKSAVLADDVLPAAHEGESGGRVQEEGPLPVVGAPPALGGDDHEQHAALAHAANARVAEERAVVGFGGPIPGGASGGHVSWVLGDDEDAERVCELEDFTHEADEVEVRGTVRLPAGGARLDRAVTVKELRGARVIAEDGDRAAWYAAENETELKAADCA